MAAPPKKITLWFENQAANIDYDSEMMAGSLEQRALQALGSNRKPPLDFRDYELITTGNTRLNPDKSLRKNGVVPDDDVLLVKRYTQGPSDIHWALGLGVYAGLLLIGSLVVLTQLWPWSSADLTPAGTRSVTLYILFYPVGTFAVGAEVLLLYVVLLSGIIGACVWSLYVLSSHLSAGQDFNRSWAAWYLVRPFLGAGLAVILYAILRAGLFSAGSGVDDTSVIGVSAMSFLVGLFTENAIHKLHEIADTVFGNPPSSPSAAQKAKP